jgi:hypothetical protein
MGIQADPGGRRGREVGTGESPVSTSWRAEQEECEPTSGDKVSGWSIAILSGICLDRGAILEQVILTSELGFSSVQLE